MSPEQRERRISAALEATHLTRRTIERALDAADRAVPVVDEAEYLANDQKWRDDFIRLQRDVERAEDAIARLEAAAGEVLGQWDAEKSGHPFSDVDPAIGRLRAALSPEYSEESGT